jgi:hypothetical protein
MRRLILFISSSETMNRKQGIRAVCFVVILAGILWWLDANIRFTPDPSSLHIARRFKELYSDPADTWDGILLGTSYTDRAWAAPLAYEMYGMTVYPMSTDSQPFALAPSMIEEVLSYQDISFAVVELHGLTTEAIYTDPVKVRRVTDNMKRSENWLKTIAAGMDFMEKWYPDTLGDNPGLIRLSYYFPLVQFHQRLSADDDGLVKEDFMPGETKMKGVYEAVQSTRTTAIHLEAHDNYPEIGEQQQELLDALFACAEKHNIQLLFLNLPTAETLETYQDDLNAAARYVQEHGYPVLNCNESEVLEASGMDGSTDYYDKGHMNARGAHRFTGFLASWLKEQVELVDHRGNAAYTGWDEAAEAYDAFYQNASAALDG